MSHDEESKWKQLEPFFGYDGRGRLFAKEFMANWSHPINSEENPNSIISTSAYYIMIAEQYKNKDGMDDSDIHPEFANFIVRTALWHKKLDYITGNGDIRVENRKDLHYLLSLVPNEITLVNINDSIKHLTTLRRRLTELGEQIAETEEHDTDDTKVVKLVADTQGAIRELNKYIEQNVVQGSTNHAPQNNKGIAKKTTLIKTKIKAICDIKNTPLQQHKTCQYAVINFWNSVYAKWNTLHEFAKKFYDMYMTPMKWDGNTWRVVPLEERGTITLTSDNCRTYRVNIKKISSTNGAQNEDNGAERVHVLQQGQDQEQDQDQDQERELREREWEQKQKMQHELEQRELQRTLQQLREQPQPQQQQHQQQPRPSLRQQQEQQHQHQQQQQQEPRQEQESERKRVTFSRQVATNPFEEEYPAGGAYNRHRSPKKGGADTTPLFLQVLPFVPLTVRLMHAIEVSTNQHTDTIIEADLNSIRDLYIRTFNHDFGHKDYAGQKKALDKFYDKMKQQTHFNVMIDKLVRARLSYISTGSPRSNEPMKDLIDFGTRQMWNRDEKGIFRLDPTTGLKIYAGSNDETPEFTRTLKTNFKCYSTLVKSTNQLTCDDYLTDCIVNKSDRGFGKCKAFMKDMNFFDVVKSEINEMHPQIAFQTLSRFGFRTHKKFDEEANMNVVKVESADHWFEHVLKKHKDIVNGGNEANAIIGNTKLKDYLDLVSQYVNANPVILNPNYNGITEEKLGKYGLSNWAFLNKIQLRVEPAVSRNVDREWRMFRNFKLSRPAMVPFRMRQNRIFTPFGASINPTGFATLIRGNSFAGGSRVDESYNRRVAAGDIQNADVLNHLIAYRMNVMEQAGVKLLPEDKQKLDEKLRQFKKLEQELTKTLEYLSAYNEMIEKYEDYDNTVISMDTLRNLARRFISLNSKYHSKETSMSRILETLQKLVLSNDDGDGDEDGDDNSYRDIDIMEVKRQLSVN